MSEPTAVGPRHDPHEVEASLRDEVESLGRIVDEQERTIGALNREVDLHARGIGWRLQTRLAPVSAWMLRIPIVRPLYRTFYRALEIWVDEGFLKIFIRSSHKVGLALRGRSPLVEGYDRRPPPSEDQYAQWITVHGAPPNAPTMHAAIASFRVRPLVSVLAQASNENATALQASIATLNAQSYTLWEVCVAPSWAEAFGQANGDYISFLEAGDSLASEALFELVARLQSEPGLDVVYSDEDWLSESGRREDPLFKPDWDADLFLSTNYLVRFGIFRRRLVSEVGGFHSSAGGGEIYDLLLRLTERTARIAHVPKVLYHCRRQPATADAVLARHAANRHESRAIEDALRRRGRPGRAQAVFTRGGSRCYATRFELTQRPLVSIVIPTRDKRALLQTTLESIWERTDYDRYEIIVIDNQSTDPDAVRYLASIGSRCQVRQWTKPFNYSALNNFGVRHARGEQLLFLNNDVEVIHADWLTAMLEHAQRPEVGAVGAKLLYADGRIQHAGVVVGINRAAANAFRSWPGATIGRPRLADLTRECSAVTGACMMVPRRVFDEVGGFDENLRVVLNDVDLCLKIRQRGHLVVYTPHALLYHYEGSSRGRLHPPPEEKLFQERWSDFLDRGDPFYNPNLSYRHDDWRIDTERRGG
jgi:GT2 family glycosyltransferase